MLGKIINSIKEGTFFEKVKHKITTTIKKKKRNRIRNNTSVNPNKIIFMTFQGKYTCNPKAICEELISRNTDFELVWVIRKDEEHRELYPKELKLVVKGTDEYYKELSSAKYIIQNANDAIYSGYNKKDDQIMIQTWHGSLGFKRLDPKSVNNEKWVNKAITSGLETDYIVSDSEFENMVYRTSYWEKTPILEYGHARNDILFDKEKCEEMNEYIRDYYHIDKDTKICLYAPTFRDDFTFVTYNLNYEKLLEALKKRYPGKWVIMVRFHFKLRNVDFPKRLLKSVVNATDYYDMQDLLCAADLGITDYSSWLCDFVLTDKPGFIYCNDMDKYVDERGFYYPLSETPFPIAKTNEEFYENIVNFDEKKYEKDRQKFLKARGSWENGTASKKIVDKIIELSKK